ncbi:thermonuclease family protein [Rhodomicrobium lacus]|uniref:thermonuclease family protein n=1 Tax=Rhodomicrobium lacus TaxID=2498452 RepID=UPI001AECAF6E|nr:thermonuclease family protein [Rhodomicrobium lacus]
MKGGIALCLVGLLVGSDLPARITVIDGDTLRYDGVTYRLIGIDAPEIRRARCDAERTLAMLAKARLAQLVADPSATIETHKRREKYGRTLARLRVRGVDVGATLAAEGLALPYDGRTKPDWCSR